MNELKNLPFNEFGAKIISNQKIGDSDKSQKLMLDIEFSYIGHIFKLRLVQTSIGQNFRQMKKERYSWLVVWNYNKVEADVLRLVQNKITQRIITLVNDYLKTKDD